VRAGLIDTIVGEVYLEGERIVFPSDRPYEVTDGIWLRTESGLAEIQLGAGAFLRVNQRTRFRMEDSNLESILLYLERGSILIEIIELYENNHITVRYKDTHIQLARHGLYRLDANGSRLQVYGGEAIVQTPGRNISVKRERAVDLLSFEKSKFNTKVNDVFHYWAAYRSFNQYRQLIKINWHLYHWQRLLMNHYKHEYYEVTFHDKEKEDASLPLSGWHQQWRMEEMRRRNEMARESEQNLERMRKMPDQIH